MVKVEINGITVEAREGSMVIEAADQAGIAIPRFCYHKKLSIAANCRMCLVEVERAPKPLPACATPVTEGMKVYTDSPKAIAAQKSVMEFLLINHPLDCPICDQGGECELQDLAMGYGSDVSRYTEAKRVVPDKFIGPLISTDMTRCIHCTRCVRFGAEVAGIRELGATGRGEHMSIGTYIERSVDSELSGNVIDLCPVGALNSKPFRFQGRGWELTQHSAVAPHDAVGSNIYIHTRRGQVMRVVPRDNEEINECWLSDRDRFSYLGVTSAERLTEPRIKQGGEWRDANWEEALAQAARRLQEIAPEQRGFLASASSTLEELFLLQKLARTGGCGNIDHRLREVDFRDQDLAPSYPGLGCSVADLESRDAFLLIGSQVNKEAPILGHRIRKAAMNGARVHAINPVNFAFSFPLQGRLLGSPERMIADLAAVCLALGVKDEAVAKLAADLEVEATHRAIAESLKGAEHGQIVLGLVAAAHPDAAVLRALARRIAAATDCVCAELTHGANAAGAWLAGCLPHRGPGGGAAPSTGLNAGQMFEQPLPAYVLLGVEPDRDCDNPARALAALGEARLVVALNAYRCAALESVADILLPISTFAETSGTFVNLEGRWQGFSGAATPPGAARPAWKVLRVLGNLSGAEGFEHRSSEEVVEELRAQIGDEPRDRAAGEGAIPVPSYRSNGSLSRVGDVPIYAADPVVRRSGALQATRDAERAEIRVHPAILEEKGLTGAARATVVQGGSSATLALVADDRVAPGVVWLAAGIAETAGLGPAIGPVDLRAEQ